jgi:phosphopantetheine adenylyltransferase
MKRRVRIRNLEHAVLIAWAYRVNTQALLKALRALEDFESS